MKKLTSPNYVQSLMKFVDLFQILLLKGLGNMLKRCNSVYLTKNVSKLPTFFWDVFTQTTHIMLSEDKFICSYISIYD